MSLKNDGDASPFVKTAKGMYGLRANDKSHSDESVDELDESIEDAEEMGLINAFGMFWRRSEVIWRRPNGTVLKGLQTAGGQDVDFSCEAGVYLLHDGSRVVYVGQVSEPRLGSRLAEHTRDRLSGRWDRFSWFGVRGAKADGSLTEVPGEFTLKNLITTMEALLIEGLEPPQNRRQGDGFKPVEFIQASDPELERQRKKRLLTDLAKTLD